MVMNQLRTSLLNALIFSILEIPSFRVLETLMNRFYINGQRRELLFFMITVTIIT